MQGKANIAALLRQRGIIFVHFPTLCVLCCLLNSGENFVLHIKQANVVLDLHLKWTTIFRSSYYTSFVCSVFLLRRRRTTYTTETLKTVLVGESPRFFLHQKKKITFSALLQFHKLTQEKIV